MIVEFRVLAVSKEQKSYDTDLIKGLFMSDHPTLDVVDTLPITTVMNILADCNWQPIVKEAINTDTHILVPYIGEIIA